jgi:hypothetical protein
VGRKDLDDRDARVSNDEGSSGRYPRYAAISGGGLSLILVGARTVLQSWDIAMA